MGYCRSRVCHRYVLQISLRLTTRQEHLNVAGKVGLSRCNWKGCALISICAFLINGYITYAIRWIDITEYIEIEPVVSVLRSYRKSEYGKKWFTYGRLYCELKGHQWLCIVISFNITLEIPISCIALNLVDITSLKL